MTETVTETEHYETAVEDRLAFMQKFAYGLGMLANNLQAAAIGALPIILNLGLGMDPRLVGYLGSIPRLFDAFVDPVIGHVSDNTRTRWGRRRPLIFVGAILSGIIFALMWQLYPGHSQMFYFWGFLAASIVFFTTYAIFSIPLVGYGYELTPDYHERTQLMGFSNFMGQIAWLICPFFYLFIYNTKIFPGDFGAVRGARILAIIIGATIIVLGVMPAIFTKERIQLPPRDREGALQSAITFFKRFIATWKSGPFLKLCLATFLVFNGYQLGSSFTFYNMTYYLFGGDATKASQLNLWFGITSSVSTLVVIWLTTRVSAKLGKRRAFCIMTFLSLFGFVAKWFTYSPAHPYLLLLSAPLISFGIGSLFTTCGAMVADVCDLDELKTGERREGMYGAIYWWMVKLGMAAAALIFGFLLNATGFDVALKGAQSVKSLMLMRAFDCGVPLVTSAIAIWAVLSYGITAAKAREMRLELETRRGKK
jgi:GPH family glycoside/pentoside/hexuronide:cation symporter